MKFWEKILDFVDKYKTYIDIFLLIMIILISYTQGKINMMKKYQSDYNALAERYEELYQEYQDYKEHSWVLLG